MEEENSYPVPASVMDVVALLAQEHAIAAGVTYLYLIHCTYRDHEPGTAIPLTMEEFLTGRHGRSGIRIDDGTGLSERAIRTSLQLLNDRGLVSVTVNNADRGRIKKYYTVQVPGEEKIKALFRPQYKHTKKQVIPGWLRTQVFERDSYRCQECGDWHDLHCDHIVPESRGGPTVFDNLQTLCATCNLRKGNRI